VFIEDEQHHCLVAVDNECVVLGCKNWPNLNRSVLVKPFEISVAVLVLIEGFEFSSDVFHFRWQSAWLGVLFRPVTTG
jgi:hypothetical protein